MKTTGLTFQEATQALQEGHKVRLPEWRGYWFKHENGLIQALTKTGEIEDAWVSAYMDRLDFEIADGLDFGWAITALKAGKLVTRAGWNGKGMFLFIRPSDELDVDMIVNKVKSLPLALKGYLADKTNPEKRSQDGSLDGTSLITFTAYLCMKAADGTIVNGWLASQTDMLATDWQLFKPA